MTQTATFRSLKFSIAEGKTHPGFSIHTFEEERPFREEHWRISPGEVVIDAGASYGSYTLSALAMGARVYAFEPEADIAFDLHRNVTLNGWEKRCDVLKVGLWDKMEKVSVYDYATHWPAGTSPSPFKMVSLDDWVASKDFTRIDWIKMDIEGAEERAIRGGIETIERFKPRIILEAHVFLDSELPRKIRSLLPGYTWDEYPREPCVMMVGRAA